ncbi:hypothetical protein O9993_18600 [Vibrio lentus]|nr:hypothetical protein [Vibrio lentus]
MEAAETPWLDVGITDVATYVCVTFRIGPFEELNAAIAASIEEQEALTVQIGSVTQSKNT